MKRYFLPIKSAMIAALLITPMLASAQNWRVYKGEYYHSSQLGAPLTLDEKTEFTYSNGRGSDPQNEEVMFDEQTWYSDMVNQPTVVTSKTSRQYDANNNVTEEIDYTYDIVNSVLVPDYKTEMVYNGNVLDSTVYYSYDNSLNQYDLDWSEKDTYNGNGKIEMVKRYDDMNVLEEMEFFSYNSNGMVTSDSMVYIMGGVPQPTSVLLYEYDVTGMLLTKLTYVSYYTGSRVVEGSNYYYYDANNLLQGDSSDTQPNGYTVRNTYQYDGQNRLIGGTHILTVRNNGTITNADSSINTISYTSFGYIDAEASTRYSLSVATNITKDSTQYYYGMYFPVGVQTVVTQGNDMVVYPVPSSNFINIKWEVAKPTKLDARIVNIQGQTVRQWSDNADGVYYKSINVGELSAGNYYIVIVANGEKIEKKITVVK